jgi:hypothetical protein
MCHSSREGSRNRLVGAGFSGTGGLGNKAARQRSKVCLWVKLHISLDCSVCHISLDCYSVGQKAILFSSSFCIDQDKRLYKTAFCVIKGYT